MPRCPFNLLNLPTSPDGLREGDVWVDIETGTLKIVV
jgi:hypothetical protein